MGQAHGEGLDEHPEEEHVYELAFAVAERLKVLPDAVLDMDGELALDFVAYLSGVARGRQIKNG